MRIQSQKSTTVKFIRLHESSLNKHFTLNFLTEHRLLLTSVLTSSNLSKYYETSGLSKIKIFEYKIYKLMTLTEGHQAR